MKKFFCITVIICSIFLGLTACGSPAPEDSDALRVGVLRGPTAMGLLELMANDEKGYEFELGTDAAAFVPALIKGEIDLAAVPANLASVIYNNSGKSVKLLAVNTLNVLYIVERGESIGSISDLAGKRLYATGEAAVPEYVLKSVLDANGLTGENAPSIQWCSDTTEALSYIASDENAAALLPQPFVSAAMLKTEGLRIALDMNAEWKKIFGSDIVNGVMLCRTELLSESPEKVEQFMRDYEESVHFVINNTEKSAELSESFGIIASAAAEKALPYCGITFMTGQEMKETVESFLAQLSSFDAKSVGGTLPDEDFYYEY